MKVKILCILFIMLSFVLKDVLSESIEKSIEIENYVIKRNGKNVTALCGNNLIVDFSNVDEKDPTQLLVAFFESYFSQTARWKDFVAAHGFYGEKEDLIDVMNEAYREFYSLPESITVTINSKNFDSKTGYYTIKIGYLYNGEEEEGDDQVSMIQDKRGCWFVQELPR